MRSLFLLSLVTVLSSACSQPETEVVSTATFEIETGAIMNGYPDTEDNAVVGIVHLSQGLGICSGSLIAPNVVLTAQHCVAPLVNAPKPGAVDCFSTSFGPTHAPISMYVTTDQMMQEGSDDWFGVAEIRVPDGTGVCGNDVALMVLAEPIPASKALPMVPRLDEPIYAPTPHLMASGEEYSAIGFGSTSDYGGGSGMRRRRDGLYATCAGTACGFMSFLETEWVGDAGVCSGDSGGPAVDMLNRVLGVASRGSAGCGNPVYGYVWAWSDWLKEQVAEATKSAGVEPPLWTTGWSTHPGAAFPMGEPCKGGGACPSMLCLDGFCTRLCDKLAPCPSGFFCDDVPAGSALYDGEYCRVGPVGDACGGAGGCKAGPCRGGYCTRTCDAELPCPAGFVCDASDNVCVLGPVGQACVADDECESRRCSAEGTCTRLCDEHLPCPKGFGCDADVAMCAPLRVGGACEADDECSGGACIGEGYCTRYCGAELGCPAGYACGEEGLCGLIPVGDECEGDGQCAGGACVDGTCTRSCGELALCPEGYTCNEVCVLAEVGAECKADEDCNGGTCEGGKCTRACSKDMPCPSGYQCVASASSGSRCEPQASAELPIGCSPAPGRSAPPVALGLLVCVLLLFGRRRRV